MFQQLLKARKETALFPLVSPTKLSISNNSTDLKACVLKAYNITKFYFGFQVLPILLKDVETLPEDTVLSCRQVGREAKRSMDKILFNYRSEGGSKMDYILRFYFQSDYVKLFSRGSSIFTRNPFHFRQFIVECSENGTYPRLLELLHSYGRKLYDVTISIVSANEGEHRLSELEAVLPHLPNVQSLSLVRFYPNQQIMENYGPDAPLVPQHVLPKLPHLKSLGLAELAFKNGQKERRAVILALLKNYGTQLTTFRCDQFVLRAGVPMDLVSSLLPNITTLEICAYYFYGDDEGDLLWEQLALANFPRLRCLALSSRLWPLPDGEMPTTGLVVTPKLLQALQKFRTSLTELRLIATCFPAKCLDVEILESNISGVTQPFEKLSKLRISADNMITSTCWTVFAKLFVNLQNIEFKKKDGDLRKRPPATEFAKLRQMFPKLKDISWPKSKPKLGALWRGVHGVIGFVAEPISEEEQRRRQR